MPLSRADCRLVTDRHARVIDEFNLAEAILEGVRAGFPNLAKHKVMLAAERILAEAREELRRTLYRIGFIGISQAGKSTTICSLLNVQEKDSPTPTGAGGATTSAITRIARDRSRPSGLPEKVLLDFMSLEQFSQRRSALCQLLDLDPSKDDPTLKVELQRRLDNPGPNSKADLRYLQQLLVSHAAHGANLGKRDVEGRYAERMKYVTHQGVGAKGENPYALLREMRIAFPTKAISGELEIIDLPGLGVEKEADVLLTMDFLNDLDGAVVFQEAKQVTGGDAAKLIRKLFSRYKRLAGRVWMVVTHFDNLLPQAKSGDANQFTVLDHLQQFLKDSELPPEQVILIGNHFYMDLIRRLPPGAEVNGNLPRPDRDTFMRSKIDLDADGNPLVPAGFRKHAVLCASYERMTRDGGVPRLREILQDTLAESVRSEMCRDVRDRLKNVAETLRNETVSGIDRAYLPVESLEAASNLESEVLAIANRIPWRESCFEDAGRSLRDEFLQSLNNKFLASLNLTPADIPARHRALCRLLKEKGLSRAAELVIAPIYDRINGLVTEMEGAPIVLPGENTRLPHDRWSAVRLVAMNAKSKEWYADVFQAFESDSFLQEPGLSRDEYMAIMRKKIDAVVFALVGRVVDRLQHELGGIRAELGRLGDERELIDREAVEGLKKLLGDIEGYLGSLGATGP